MPVLECDLPLDSALSRCGVETAYFRDSYRAPLVCKDLGIIDVFFALFGHAPLYVKLLLITRNAIAKLAGLEVPTIAQIMKPEIRSTYSVGERIGPWPIFALSDSEIVAGRNNKHLDFRLSVLKRVDDGAASVTVSTVCTVHNLAGKVYLFFILPFHRFGVKALMSNAIAANRL
jgi:Protein of unknown function (DUF2867)